MTLTLTAAITLIGYGGCATKTAQVNPSLHGSVPAPSLVMTRPMIDSLPEGKESVSNIDSPRRLTKLDAFPIALQAEEPLRPWTYIVFHHTATGGGDVDAIDAAHRQRTDEAGRPWLGIGYHFVIGNGNGMPDGLIEPTFRWTQQLHGAHAGDRIHNETGIGICLVGDFEESPPTERQLASLKQLVSMLRKQFDISSDHLVGHGSLKPTACPGRFFPLQEVIAATEKVTSPDQDTVVAADVLR